MDNVFLASRILVVRHFFYVISVDMKRQFSEQGSKENPDDIGTETKLRKVSRIGICLHSLCRKIISKVK